MHFAEQGIATALANVALQLTGADVQAIVAPVSIANESFGILPELALQLSLSVRRMPTFPECSWSDVNLFRAGHE